MRAFILLSLPAVLGFSGCGPSRAEKDYEFLASTAYDSFFRATTRYVCDFSSWPSERFRRRLGDVLEIPGTSYRGLVCHFRCDDGQIWYGIVPLMADDRIFGRNIQKLTGPCIETQDFFYMDSALLGQLKFLEHLTLDTGKIGIGGSGIVKSIIDLKNEIALGVKDRLETPSPCNQPPEPGVKFRNSTYTSLSEIVQ